MGKMNIQQSMLKKSNFRFSETVDVVGLEIISHQFNNAIMLLNVVASQRSGDIVLIEPSILNMKKIDGSAGKALHIYLYDTDKNVELNILITDEEVKFSAFKKIKDSRLTKVIFEFSIIYDKIKNTFVNPFYEMLMECVNKVKNRFMEELND